MTTPVVSIPLSACFMYIGLVFLFSWPCQYQDDHIFAFMPIPGSFLGLRNITTFKFILLALPRPVSFQTVDSGRGMDVPAEAYSMHMSILL